MNVFLGGAIAISFVLAFIAAILVVIRAPNEPVRRWLAFFLFFAASWGVIVNFQMASTSPDYNLWVVRLTFITAILMLYAMYQFAMAVTHIKLNNFFQIFLNLMTVVVLVATMTDIVISGVAIQANAVIPDRMPGYYAVTAYILGLAILSVGMIGRAYRRTNRLAEKTRLGIVLFGLAVGIIFGTLTNIIMPNILGTIEPARYAWVSIVFWTVILVYAIVRHRFLDVRLAVVRSVAYFLVLATMVGMYFGVAFLLSSTLRQTLNNPIEIITNIIIALMLALAFQPIKRFFDRMTNRIFYRDNYNTEDFFARLSRELSSSTDLRNLLQKAAREIGETMKAEYAFFAVRYGGARHRMTAGTERHGRLYQAELDDLDEHVTTQGQTVVVADMLDEKDPLYKVLTRHKVAVALPLIQNDEIIGYLFLGRQRSRDYTRRDIRALETISDELVIAIQNALSVQEVRDINATLQQRIEEATKELRHTNLQLQRLDAAKDEFVSMASHQLRTPLTSVKGYISMVLEGDVGRISNTQRQLLGEAFTSSERMVHLINDFLNVSRLQTGKFILEDHPVDLSKLIAQEVDSLKTTAEAHALKLSYRAPSYFPTLIIDEGKIRQVAMNFIDNAIYYSHEGTTIEVKLYIEGGDAVLEVHDTGIGVPKSEQAHLFSKFFRATNARRQRPDGTGVGLFLAKKVIVAHGGSIVFESKEGEGSVFGFRLPVKQLSTKEKAEELEEQPA